MTITETDQAPKMQEVQVDVTQEDIDQGVRSSTKNCPIALAIRRALAKLDIVHPDGIVVETRGPGGAKYIFGAVPHYVRCLLGPEATQFAQDFDDHPSDGPFAAKPFSFTFSLPV